VREICDTSVPDDGIVFRGDTIVAARIKDDAEYEGVRVRLHAELAGARIPVQIDVGFGDAVQPREDSHPVLLEDFAPPDLRIYPREAVVAEKVQAMVDLGLANSRMKDFWDVQQLARQPELRGAGRASASIDSAPPRGGPPPRPALRGPQDPRPQRPVLVRERPQVQEVLREVSGGRATMGV